MDYKGIQLDTFQEHAIHAVEHNKSVVVSAPTGSGKTLIADYIIDRDIKKGIRVIYTAPIKALSNQKFKDFCKMYGEDKVGLLTGDTVKNPDASVLIMTTEIYRNMAIIKDPTLDKVSYVVFDEIHYINDPERGYVWEESIIFSPPTIRMLCLSATIPNADEFARWIETIKEHPVVLVTHSERSVPLQVSFYDHALGITSLRELQSIMSIPSYEEVLGYGYNSREKHPVPSHVELVKELADKTPCLFFCFSRNGCQIRAKELAEKRLFTPDARITTTIREHLAKASPEISKLDTTRLLRQILSFGVGFHHAGLLPVMKEIVEDLFAQGLLKVLYTTETFAVGINMPAKTVCFESLRKFDGSQFRFLHSKEFFQIAGRAGRRGIDKEGYAIAMINRRDFNGKLLEKITKTDTEPIRSQFHLSTNTVLNLIHRHSAQDIEKVLHKSFFTYQKNGANFKKGHSLRASFEKHKHKLERLDYVLAEKLTPKGVFCSRIYSDEILMSEVFATDFYKQLTALQILVLIGCVCFESRDKDEKTTLTHDERLFLELLHKHPILRKEKCFEKISQVTKLINPCYDEQSIFQIFAETQLLEGDVIRFFRQIMDRLSQIQNATQEKELRDITSHVIDKIKKLLEEVDVL